MASVRAIPLWNRIHAADPDRARLHLALRVTGTTLLALFVCVLLARLLHQPPAEALVGAMVLMSGSMIVNDPTRRGQLVTMVCLPFVASASLAVASVCAASIATSTLALCAVVFLAIWVRRFGPRGMALGMVAFMAFFFTLFFKPQRAQLPWLCGAVFAATVAAAFVQFVLLRERPAQHLRTQLRGFLAAAGVALERISLQARSPGAKVPALRARHALAHLNEAAVGLEEYLRRPEVRVKALVNEEALLLRVLDLELAVGRVGALLRGMSDPSPWADAIEASARGLLRGEDRAVTGGGPLQHALEAVRVSAQELREDAERTLERPAGPERDHPSRRARALGDAGPALRAGRAAENDVHSTSADRPERVGGASAEPIAASDRPALSLTTRQAIQGTIATGLAAVIGAAISHDRWYWAALAAFVVYARATTSADTLARAVGRVLGTVAGVIGGLLLAHVVQGSKGVELALLFACLFFAMYMLRASYAWMVFGFTVAIALLYGLLGRLTPALLSLRIEETLVGAAAGAGVGLAILPSRTRATARRHVAKVLRAWAAYMTEAARRGRTPEDRAVLQAKVRVLDENTRELRAIARALIGGPIIWAPNTVRRVHATTSLAFCARQLARGDVVDTDGVVSARATELASRAIALADALEQLEGQRFADTLRSPGSNRSSATTAATVAPSPTLEPDRFAAERPSASDEQRADLRRSLATTGRPPTPRTEPAPYKAAEPPARAPTEVLDALLRMNDLLDELTAAYFPEEPSSRSAHLVRRALESTT